MAFGTGANTRLAHIAETTFGVIPATPIWLMDRVVSSALRVNKTVVVSNERQPDRNVRDVLMTGIDAGGSVPFEFPYGAHDDLMAAAFMGNWSANVLKNGNVRKSFTFEETIELGATDDFFRYPGSMIAGMSLDISSRSLVTGSFDIFSQKVLTDTAIVAGATYTAENANEIMTASVSVASLNVDGMAPQPKIRRLSFGVNNNFRRRPLVGDLYSDEYGEGVCDVTGTIEAYYSSKALYDKVLAHGLGTLTFTLGHQTNKKYTVNFPAIRLTDGGVVTGGKNDDVIVNTAFQGIYSSADAASIVITRAIA